MGLSQLLNAPSSSHSPLNVHFPIVIDREISVKPSSDSTTYSNELRRLLGTQTVGLGYSRTLAVKLCSRGFLWKSFAALPHGSCSSGTLWYHPDSSDRTTTGQTNGCRRQRIFKREKAMNEQAYQFKTWLNVIYDLVWKIRTFLWLFRA